MKYERVCGHVILLDVCYTIKRPTTMCFAKTIPQKSPKKALRRQGENVLAMLSAAFIAASANLRYQR